ncbi:hypothetical protein ACRALDRAFT_207722 [Sodiomyces alcalophilus JCM 7366]|uniref:uncharacterized protein n=1 Tax=Sodiomyces alcalophilus JCM 7366 TaxID=591952 RepID=UPI0039B49273
MYLVHGVSTYVRSQRGTTPSNPRRKESCISTPISPYPYEVRCTSYTHSVQPSLGSFPIARVPLSGSVASDDGFGKSSDAPFTGMLRTFLLSGRWKRRQYLALFTTYNVQRTLYIHKRLCTHSDGISRGPFILGPGSVPTLPVRQLLVVQGKIGLSLARERTAPVGWSATRAVHDGGALENVLIGLLPIVTFRQREALGYIRATSYETGMCFCVTFTHQHNNGHQSWVGMTRIIPPALSSFSLRRYHCTMTHTVGLVHCIDPGVAQHNTHCIMQHPQSALLPRRATCAVVVVVVKTTRVNLSRPAWANPHEDCRQKKKIPQLGNNTSKPLTGARPLSTFDAGAWGSKAGLGGVSLSPSEMVGNVGNGMNQCRSEARCTPGALDLAAAHSHPFFFSSLGLTEAPLIFQHDQRAIAAILTWVKSFAVIRCVGDRSLAYVVSEGSRWSRPVPKWLERKAFRSAKRICVAFTGNLV